MFSSCVLCLHLFYTSKYEKLKWNPINICCSYHQPGVDLIPFLKQCIKSFIPLKPQAFRAIKVPVLVIYVHVSIKFMYHSRLKHALSRFCPPPPFLKCYYDKVKKKKNAAFLVTEKLENTSSSILMTFPCWKTYNLISDSYKALTLQTFSLQPLIITKVFNYRNNNI